MIGFLHSARRKGEKARHKAAQIERSFSEDCLNQRIEEALDTGQLSTEDLKCLISKALTMEVGERLKVSEDWIVSSIARDGIATVVSGRRWGKTPVDDHHDSWICSRCGWLGPWNGNRCMNCGNLEAPN